MAASATTISLTASCILTAVVCALGAQGSGAPPQNAVVRVDPGLDAIVASDARLEVLKSDYFGLAESPLWTREGASGYLLFSDIAGNVIYRYAPPDRFTVFLEKSGFTGTDLTNVNVVSNGRLTVATFGSNGLARDREGRLVLCAQGDRAIVRIEPDGTRTIVADRFDGKRFSSPNDLIVRSDGAVYFTDQTIGLRGGAKSPARELPFNGVYLVKDGQVQLLDQTLPGPNGIALSPDEKYLYVNGGKEVFRYQVRPDGSVSDRERFFTMPAQDDAGGADGMKVDERGNVYFADHANVWILSPGGRHLGNIRVPDATNVAFGDVDGRTLYVTARRSLYRIRVNIAGVR